MDPRAGGRANRRWSRSWPQWRRSDRDDTVELFQGLRLRDGEIVDMQDCLDRLEALKAIGAGARLRSHRPGHAFRCRRLARRGQCLASRGQCHQRIAAGHLMSHDRGNPSGKPGLAQYTLESKGETTPPWGVPVAGRRTAPSSIHPKIPHSSRAGSIVCARRVPRLRARPRRKRRVSTVRREEI